VVDSNRSSTQSARYLEHAEALLARGDLPQASEKYWGSVAQATKALAAERHWRHSTHRDLRRVLSRLYGTTNDREFLRLFAIAEALHANFYENYLEGPVMEAYAEDARRLVVMLNGQRNGKV